MKFENHNFLLDNCSDDGGSDHFEPQTDDQLIPTDVTNDGSFILATDMGDIKIEIAQPYLDDFSSTNPKFENRELIDDGG